MNGRARSLKRNGSGRPEYIGLGGFKVGGGERLGDREREEIGAEWDDTRREA